MDMLWTFQMDLTKGWVVRDPVPNNQITQPIYACDDPMLWTQEYAKFDADPIVHLIRESGMSQLLALASR